MKASYLKKKYSELWDHVESRVLEDLRQCMPQNLVIMSEEEPPNKHCRLRRVAHNAAFFATSKIYDMRVK